MWVESNLLVANQNELPIDERRLGSLTNWTCKGVKSIDSRLSKQNYSLQARKKKDRSSVGIII